MRCQLKHKANGGAWLSESERGSTGREGKVLTEAACQVSRVYKARGMDSAPDCARLSGACAFILGQESTEKPALEPF